MTQLKIDFENNKILEELININEFEGEELNNKIEFNENQLTLI